MSIDRAATLRQAEKLLRQGRLDQAIAEYLRIVEDQPHDWNTANLLGDVYVRTGQIDRAIEQFTRVAQNLRREGFLPRASAAYKKILKLQPDADGALVQAAELAVEQGLLADARALLSTAAAGRRARGDSRGALEITVRLGSLDPSDVDARMAAARARLELDDAPGALQAFTDLATMLIEGGRETEALAPLREAAVLDPRNPFATRELARILMAQGHVDEAATYLDAESAGSDPALILLAAEARLRAGDAAPGLDLVERLLVADDSAPQAVEQLALSLASTEYELAFRVVERVVGVSVERSDWAGAADVLDRFVGRTPSHIAALTRLVDVCVDGGLPERRLLDAQARLADAYLAAGAAAEARYVAEDLLTRQPGEPAHAARLRAALAAAGEADPDRAVAGRLAELAALHEPEPIQQPPVQKTAAPAGSGGFAAADSPRPSRIVQLDVPNDAVGDEPMLPAMPAAKVEEDLSDLLDRIPPPAPVVPVRPAPPASPATAAPPALSASPATPAAASITSASVPPVPPATASDRPASAEPEDIEAVFAHMRDRAELATDDDAADVALTRGAALLEAGEFAASEQSLRAAARWPKRRFAAALLLARLYEQQKRMADAVEWLGHAVDAPAATREERFDTLHRLADILERSGEPESALAVCLELQADAGAYRDLADRIERLSRAGGG